MADHKEQVLPYRTSGDDLSRLLDARARGRTLEQIQTLNFSRKALEGTVTAAAALGFLDVESSELTSVGKEYALANNEDRHRLLIAAMLRFEPFELLLEATVREGAEVTDVRWIETWWNAHGYGSSQTNRAEASSAFARLAEFVGLGAYIQGRRGKDTRIEWHDDAKVALQNIRPPAPETLSGDSAPYPPPNAVEKTKPLGLSAEVSRLVLHLGQGRVAELTLPPRLSLEQKKRLLDIIELTVGEEESSETDQGGSDAG